jgi:hypothetical protein
MIGRGNRSTRRKPAPVPLCPPQTPHAARTRTRAAAVGSQRLTAELRHGLSSKVAVQGLDFMAHPLYIHILCRTEFLVVKINVHYIWFVVLRAVVMKSSSSWDTTPCSHPSSCCFLAWFNLQFWRWRPYFPPKHGSRSPDCMALYPVRRNSSNIHQFVDLKKRIWRKFNVRSKVSKFLELWF